MYRYIKLDQRGIFDNNDNQFYESKMLHIFEWVWMFSWFLRLDNQIWEIDI